VAGERSIRAAALLAWSLAAASLVLLLTAETFSYLSRSVAPASVDGSNWIDDWIDFGIAVMVASYLTVGALVASRRPSNAVGWLLSVVGLATAVQIFTDKYAPYAKDMDLAGAERQRRSRSGALPSGPCHHSHKTLGSLLLSPRGRRSTSTRMSVPTTMGRGPRVPFPARLLTFGCISAYARTRTNP
jgi:hypothetical protein